ncbi:MAG: hypothetical protein ACOYI2_01685 [Bacillota bacterium]
MGERIKQVAEPEIPPLSKNGVNHVKMDFMSIRVEPREITSRPCSMQAAEREVF